jgi:hypothetical protein
VFISGWSILVFLKRTMLVLLVFMLRVGIEPLTSVIMFNVVPHHG